MYEQIIVECYHPFCYTSVLTRKIVSEMTYNCVEWDVKPYYTIPSGEVLFSVACIWNLVDIVTRNNKGTKCCLSCLVLNNIVGQTE